MNTLKHIDRKTLGQLRRRRAFSLTRAGLLCGLLAGSAKAAPITWGNVGSQWSLGANWVGNTAPLNDTTTDTAVFGSTGAAAVNPNLTANRSITGVTFSSGAYAYTIGGSTLTIGATGITNSATNTEAFANQVNASAAQSWTTASGGTLRLDGTVDLGATGTSARTLTVTGAGSTIFNGVIQNSSSGSTGNLTFSTGAFTLNAQNTYNGTTTVTSGTLKTGINSALPSGTALTVGNSTISSTKASFDLNGTTQSVASLNLFGNTTSGVANYNSITIGTGALTVNGNVTYGTGQGGSYPFIISGGTLNLGGGNRTFAITNNANSSTGGDLQISSAIANGGLIKTGATSILTLSGANTYVGLTDVQVGTLLYGANNVTADGASIKVSGGTLAMSTFSDTVAGVSLTSGSITGTGTLTSTTAFDVQSGTVAPILAGSVGLTKTTSGSVTLSGANTYTGLTDVQAGTLTYGASNVLADTSTLRVSGGTLAMSTFSDTVAGVSLTSGSITGTGTLTSTSAFDVQNGSIAPILAGSVGLNKTTSNTVTLSGTNTYTGDTTISAGTLAYGVSNAIADTSTVKVSGGTLAISTYSDTVGGVQLTSGGSITGTTGVFTSVSAYDAQSGSVSAILGGSVGLIKTTSGTVNLAGTNTYTGTTGIQEGALQLTGGSNRLPAASVVTLGSATTAGKLILGDGTAASNQTVTGLTATGNGGSVVGGNAATASVLTTNIASGTNTFAGTLGGATTAENSLALSKTGSGALTLASANTYAGGTTISAGTVNLAASGAVSTGGVTMSNGNLYGGNGTSHVNAVTIGTAASSTSGTIAGWDFSTLTNGGPSPLVASTAATNVLVGGLTRGSGVNTGTTTSPYWGGTNWTAASAAAAVTAGQYATFTLKSTSGALNLSNIGVYMTNVSNTGPTSMHWEYSLDNSTYTNLTATDVSTGGGGGTGSKTMSQSAITLPTALQNVAANTTVYFRLDNYGATSTGGTWYLTDLGNSTANDLVINGTVAVPASGTGTLGISEAGSTTFSGAIIVNNTATLTAVTNGTANFTNVLSGAGSVTKTDAGTVVLSAANTYTGGTTISGGVLALGNGATTGSLSTASAIVNNGNLTINRSNAVAQGIDFSSAAITGSGSFTQSGAGATIMNAANTFSGGTTVSAGSLQVSNTDSATSATGSGAVSVSTSGTLLGTGYINAGANKITVDGTLSPGTTGTPVTPGTIHLASTATTGALTLSSTSFLVFDIVTTANKDLVALGSSTFNSLTLGGGTLALNLPNLTRTGIDYTQPYTIFSGVSGLSAGSAFGSVTGYDTTDYAATFAYDGATGNYNLSFSEVPEPTTVLGGLLLLGAAGWGQRRRLRGGWQTLRRAA